MADIQLGVSLRLLPCYTESIAQNSPPATKDYQFRPWSNSRGQHGSLPTGRVPTAHNGRKTVAIVNKNAEERYECPYCNKTYLHLKHMNRHTLRHTGGRPYSCPLCNVTFGRIDILKRHFQKCSIRRGNPTGTNHLQHSQNHLKNRQPKNHPRNAVLPSTDGGYPMTGFSGLPVTSHVQMSIEHYPQPHNTAHVSEPDSQHPYSIPFFEHADRGH